MNNLLAVALLLGVTPPVAAQEAGSELTVHLVTIDPGSSAYEYFGHNAIWVHNSATGSSTAYNWGVFDFDQPGFYGRFLRGRMLYMMGAYDLDRMVYAYQQSNRSVHVQELNLTPAQKQTLNQYVQWNALPENRDYRYHYYRDNCSTRVRDVLDRALGGELRRVLGAQNSGQTYRTETQRLSAHNLPVYTGLMIAMGPMLDEPLSAWDDSFIPMRLQEWVRAVKNAGQPLVASERTLYQSSREPPPAAAANLLPAFLVAGLALGAILILLGTRPGRAPRRVFYGLAGVLELVIGLVGSIMLLLWLFTDHDVTYRNENLLQANPFSVVIFAALIAWWLGKPWAGKIAARFALVVAGLAVLGLAVQMLPDLDQTNGEIIALLLPIHLAVAFVAARHVRQVTPHTSAASQN